MDHTPIKTVVAHIRENLAPLLLVVSCIAIFAVVVLNVRPHGLFTIQSAAAIGGYSAVDALGQAVGGSPVYDTSVSNNGPGPRRLGVHQYSTYSGSTNGVIDTVGHRLFVSDPDNNRVLEYDLDGSNQLVDSIADHVLGQPDFIHNGTATSQSGLYGPAGLAYDETGHRLFVVSKYDHRVMMWDLTGGLTDGMNATAVLGASDFNTAGFGTLDEFGLSYPDGAAYDASSGWLYIADTSHNRIMVWNVSGAVTNGMAAYRVIGQSSFTSTSFGCDAQNLGGPKGIAVYGGKAFVTDNNIRVVVFNVGDGIDGPGAQEVAVNVLGQPNLSTCAYQGAGADSLYFPTGVSVDASTGRLFVSQQYANRVLAFNVSGVISDGMLAEHVLGSATFVNAPGGTTQSEFSTPMGVTAATGILFVHDYGNMRIMEFDTTPLVDGENAIGLVGHINDAGAPQYNAQNPIPYNDGFDSPESVALDAVRHRLFVSDSVNNRILVFNLGTDNLLTDRTADFIIGQPNFASSSARTTADGLNNPSGIVYDTAHDKLYVADQDNNRVLQYDTSSLATGMSASYVLGQPDFTGNSAGLSSTSMQTPRSVAVDEAGSRLFVADSVNNRVLVFDVRQAGSTPLARCLDVDTTTGIADGMVATCLIGQPDFVTDSAFDSGSLNRPYGVAYDPTHNRLFAFQSGGILLFDVSTITPLQPLLSQFGDGFGATRTSTNINSLQSNCQILGTNAQPVYDAANDRLFVPDSCNNRVMIWSGDSFTTGANASDVVGQLNFSTATGATTASGLKVPMGLAFNPVNNYLYVADSGNNRVMVFLVPPLPPPQFPTPHTATDDLGQIDGVDTPIFTKNAANNVPNVYGFQNNLGGVALDAVHHRLFVTDRGNYRVLVYNLNSANQLVDRVAANVIGQADFRSNVVITVDQAHLRDPAGLAYDPNHNLLFVADGPSGYACRIMVFDVSNITNGMDAVHVLGRSSFFDSTCNDFVQLERNQTRTPFYLAYDAVHDRLFDSELSGPRVLSWDLANGITDGMDATHVLGQFDFHTQDVAMLNSPVGQRFYLPSGIAYDSVNDRLFVADQSEYRITIFNVASASFTDGETADHVLGAPDLTTRGTCPDPPTQSNTCFGQALAYDEANSRLFVVDNGNYRTLVFNVAPGFTDGEPAAFELGQAGFDFSTFNAPPTATSSNDPIGAAYDPGNQMLYVTDNGNHRVLQYDVNAISNGEPAVNGLGQLDVNDAMQFDTNRIDNAPNAQGLDQPNYIALDEVHHRMFVEDFANNRVLVFNLNTDNTLTDHTADYVLGQPDFSSTTAATTQSGMSRPLGVAYDPTNDRLFVSEGNDGLFNNRILVFDVRPSGSSPVDLCGDGATTGIATGMNASCVLGQPDYTTTGASTTQHGFTYPAGIALDVTAQRLYVSDTGNNRVLVFDVRATTGDPIDICSNGTTTDGLVDNMNASCELGQPSSPDPFGSAVSGLSSASMNTPDGVSIDESGHRLFVADQSNNRVLEFNLSGAFSNGIGASHVLGQTTFGAATGGTDQDKLSNPLAPLYVPSEGNLYVSDYNNNRVMVFDVSSITDGEKAVDAFGQSDFTVSTGGTSDTKLSGPYGMAYDTTHPALWVTDYSNNRVLGFNLSPPTPTPTATATPASGGHSYIPPAELGFFPDKILINDDQSSTDSKNVLVSVYAHYSPTFTGTIDVLLSNTPDFAATIPFRYAISATGTNTAWPKTIAWDLCFGLPATTPCNPGKKTVYARFYVNVPDIWPALTPLVPTDKTTPR